MFIRIGLGVVFLIGLLLTVGVYALFHGYFDHGLFEVKQAEWSPSAQHRLAVVAERSDHQAMRSNDYFVIIADHVLSPNELRAAYYSGDVIFAAAAAADCLTVHWGDSHHLALNCRGGEIDAQHINVRKEKAHDVSITYVHIADSTAKEFKPGF